MSLSSKSLILPITMPRAWVICSLVLFTIANAMWGCASASQERTSGVITDTIAVRMVPGASRAALRVVTEQKSVSLLSGTTEAELRVLSADSTVLRYPLTFTSMGAPGKTETLTTMITADLPSEIAAGAIEMSISAKADSKERTFAVSALVDTAALELAPSMTRQNDGTYQFMLRATRRRIVPEEYFPSSEQLRIAIFSAKGATVWSSNDGMAYLTVVMPVEPALQGASHLYSLDWNGMASDGARLPTGRYQVQLTLPVRPAPYSCFLDVVLP